MGCVGGGVVGLGELEKEGQAAGGQVPALALGEEGRETEVKICVAERKRR